MTDAPAPSPTPNAPTPNAPTPNAPTPNAPTPNAPTPNVSTQNVTVVKISGTLFDDADALASFWEAVRDLAAEGPLVLVHGGGKQATALAERLGHTPTVVQGRRVTTDLDLDVVQWALCGKLNTQLVATAARYGLRAIGLSGADDGLLQVEKRPTWTIDGESVDFGWVGDVTGVDPSLLDDLLTAGCTPIIAPLGIDTAGQVYNVNADTVAQNIASALGAQTLLFVTGTGGVQRAASSPAPRPPRPCRRAMQRRRRPASRTDGLPMACASRWRLPSPRSTRASARLSSARPTTFDRRATPRRSSSDCLAA